MPYEILASAVDATAYTAFPDLGLRPVIHDFGFFQLRWYSLAYLAGIILGWWLLTRMVAAPGSPMARRHADDLIFWVTIGIIAGGRLGYVVFYAPELFAQPWRILTDINKGGMSFHGGLIGVTLAMLWVARSNRLSFFRMCDYVACVVPIGLFLGRMANFVNGELWGRTTDVPWAIRFVETGPFGGTLLGPPRHPSQLYEAALEGLLLLAVLALLFWRSDARYKPGFLAGVFLFGYGLSRFAVEFFREPDAQLLWLAERTGFSMGQWLTVPMLLLGLWLMLTARARRQRVEPVAGSASVA